MVAPWIRIPIEVDTMGKPITRELGAELKTLSDKYPVITITGPRQSGKTTLCRMIFDELPYSNLEDPDLRNYAQTDPRGFLEGIPAGGIIDEFQRVPELASYIQGIVDAPEFSGTFVLTGSRNLAVRNTVNQSLAGRTALACLLPFSINEISSHWGGLGMDDYLYRGAFPRIYDLNLDPTRALADYVGTYLERDVRQLSMIKDLSLFQKFVGLCSGRIGQLLNLESLGNDTGIAQSTAREWLSLLEASYIAFRLPPFHANISKRLIKSPKLYFYDVGLVCYLLGITDPRQLATHPLRGAIYENLVILEVMKYFLNRGPSRKLFFYRDSNGNEVDLVIPRGQAFVPIEIKAAATVNGSFFKGLTQFASAVSSAADPVLVHGGSARRLQNGTRITDLQHLSLTLDELFDQA
jgi:predicted AAA+ superfamily ATPase